MQNETDDSRKRVCFHNHVVRKEDLKPGDHIYTYRRHGLYAHHGIYLGADQEECEVVHVSSVEKSKSNATVIGTTLKEFLADGTLRLVAYDSPVVTRMMKRFGSCHCNESRPAKEVIQTAKEYLSHPETWGSYNLFRRNCEHFAVYCKTKRESSAQVEGPVGGFISVVISHELEKSKVLRQNNLEEQLRMFEN